MLPQHLPRAHIGGGQSTNATTQQIVRLIHYLSSANPGGIGFLWDSSVRSPLPPHVHSTMGPSIVPNASKCGSGAHRPSHLWRNFVTNSKLENAYTTLSNPPRTVDEILATNGQEEWSTVDTTAIETSPRPTQYCNASAQNQPRGPQWPMAHAHHRASYLRTEP